MSSSRYYNHLVQQIEYNPRLFLILLIWACVVVFAYQFASMMISQWMMAALAVVALLAVVAILTWPFYAALIFIGLSAWIPNFSRGGTMMGLGGALVYPGDLFIGCFFIIEFFRGCMRQTRLYTATDRWVLAFLVWGMVCVARGAYSYSHSAIGESREILMAITYFFVIHHLTRPEHAETAVKWLAWTCVVIGAVMMYYFVQGGFRPRLLGPGGSAFHGALNVIVLGVLLGRDQIKRYRLVASACFIVLLALVLYSGLRSIILAILVSLPFVAIAGRRHIIKGVGLCLLGVFAFGMLAVIMDPVFGGQLIPKLEKQLLGLINPAQDVTGSWRLYSFQWEMERIFSNPFWVLIGQGFGGYYEWFFGYFGVDAIRTAPHNQYIQIWSKMGFLGLSFYLGLLISFFCQAFRFLNHSRNETHRSVMMILMIVVLAEMVSQWAYGLHPSMWALLAFGTALPRLWAQQTVAPQVIHTSLPSSASSRRATIPKSAFASDVRSKRLS